MHTMNSLLWLVCLGLALSVSAERIHEKVSLSEYYSSPVVWRPMNENVDDVVPNVESTGDVAPVKLESKDAPVEYHYTQHRGSSVASGDFVPDARPWWLDPRFSNYGNPPLNRYQGSYDPRYFVNSGFNQDAQNQGVRNFPQYSGVDDSVPSVELNVGGCLTQYWISNTQRWPTFFHVKSLLSDAFGTPAANVFGETTLLQALLNTRTDGYSSLMRSGATAILNAYSRTQYQFSHQKVIEKFNAALVSRQDAAQQAAMFDEANVSSYTEQYNSCA